MSVSRREFLKTAAASSALAALGVPGQPLLLPQMNAPGRLLHPMIRKGEGFQQVTWEEAMALVAAKLREAVQKFTNNVDGNPRLCMAGATAGYITTYGKDEPTGCYEDIDHALHDVSRRRRGAVIAGVLIETLPGTEPRVAARLLSVPGVTLHGGDGHRRIAAVLEASSGETLEQVSERLLASDEEILGLFPTFVGSEDAPA